MPSFSLFRTIRSHLHWGRSTKLTVSTGPPLAPQLKQWDKGVFASELIKKQIFPRAVSADKNDFITPSNSAAHIAEGTYQGSKQAATQMYNRIEQRFVFNSEPS